MDIVLVELDVRSAAEEPLRWAAEYCRLVDDEVVGVVAYEPEQAEKPPDWEEARDAEVRKRAEGAMDEVAAGVPHRVEMHHGDARMVITDVTGAANPALVVVGAGGNGGFHRLGWGSLAHHLARDLVIPLVVVPLLGGGLGSSPIVVGMDGSAGDVVTLRWALELAGAVGASVTVVYASDPMASSYGHPRGQTIADQKEMTVHNQVHALAPAGADISVCVVVDEPVAALTGVADRIDASLIVVGRKGAGQLRGLVLGRVPAHLPFQAGRPVAIVPRHSAH